MFKFLNGFFLSEIFIWFIIGVVVFILWGGAEELFFCYEILWDSKWVRWPCVCGGKSMFCRVKFKCVAGSMSLGRYKVY